MSDQDDRDDRMLKRKTGKRYQESRTRLEALLIAKNGASKEPPPRAMLDPIAAAIKNNPGLTGEEVAKFAEAFGF